MTKIVPQLPNLSQTFRISECSGFDPASRPSISVCMATFNGERYVRRQLESILSQLATEDEIVVVDDCSSDNTVETVLAMQDCRIKLLRHSKNAGVTKTFEDAIRQATGEILFLSDQDDIWAANKVNRICEAFKSDASLQVVATGYQIIDELGHESYDKTYSNWFPFRPGLIANLWVNRFLGSTMALRTSFVPKILPFPVRYYVAHDAWIGARSAVTGGRTAYIDEPLLFYRRHQHNVSSPLRWHLRFKKRAHLIAALLTYAVRRQR